MHTQAEDDAEQAARFAGQDDTPEAARLRRALVRKYAITQAFPGQPVTDYPHLAADVAMQIMGPLLAEIAADATDAVRRIRAVAGDTAEEALTRRLAVIEAAARASERAACAAQLREESRTLAATVLEAAGPDAAVAARDVVALASAAQSLSSRDAPQ